MNFEDYLKNSALEVEKELKIILSDFSKKTKKVNPKLKSYVSKFIKANYGGKRIRGVLCNLGYQIATTHLPGVSLGWFDFTHHKSARDKKTRSLEGGITKVAAALEILHTALLIHDDIMDKSLTRRNKPSLYQALGGKHKAISQAISLGDIGFYLPVKIISESKFSEELKIKTLSFLSEVIINTGWGQILDMELTQSDHTFQESPSAGLTSLTTSPLRTRKPAPEVIKFINLFKTAKYTVAGPMQIGAILGGANENLLGLLGKFGENLGVAFQIQDDILDGQAGKLDLERKEALKYVSKAKELIPEITNDLKMRKLLEQMGEYMMERTK